jgi:aspartokinase-like uncharacterized kinase
VIVVKVGGSLFDHPDLGPGLMLWMQECGGDGPFVLVPGGGAAADAVRAWDRIHDIGDVGSHWLAVRAMSLTAALLCRLLPWATLIHDPREERGPHFRHGRDRVLDPHDFCRADETLPMSWDVTADSIAARAAAVANASRLVLLKSVDVPPGTDWQTAAANGWVDAYFPRAVEGAAFAIEVVNFRRWLEAHP